MHWTLSKKDSNDTLALNPQFDWVDEFAWQPWVISKPIYTLTGAMIVETGLKKAGRPITLNGDNAYITRADLKTLLAWAAAPGTFNLSCPDGRVFEVIFTDTALTNVKAMVSYRMADKSDDDLYHATIHLLTL